MVRTAFIRGKILYAEGDWVGTLWVCRKPKLLDIFCGAGGAAVGYSRAGFGEIVGIDHKPMPRYPFEFIQSDVFEWMDNNDLSKFDLIHASPPCQRFSVGTPNPLQHPDLISKIRKYLKVAKRLYVIENVRKAPLNASLCIKGASVGLNKIKRARYFEMNWSTSDLLPEPIYISPVITVTGEGTPSGNIATWGRNITQIERQEAMGINWMNRKELSQAIPPAYTKWIGKQALKYIDTKLFTLEPERDMWRRELTDEFNVDLTGCEVVDVVGHREEIKT